MSQTNPEKNNYDRISISRVGKEKRTNYVQDAMHVEKEKVAAPGKFVKTLANVFLKREFGAKMYF